MAQAAKIIDVTRSYVPVDPNTFPQTMHGTSAEDNPENRIPVIPYQGFNFLPTVYGYRSFFGTTSSLDVDALTSRVDELFIVQNDALQNILVALCEDGIWTKRGDISGAWAHDIVLSIPSPGTHKEWTFCVIANVLYMYRQGESSVWKMGTATAWIPTAFVPNTLTMAGQMGIFRAGARLGFWDSDGAIAWSNFDNLADFVPSVATMAGFAKFNGIAGKIVTIKAEDDGFIIYCTKSIVRVVRNFSSAYLWETKVLIENAGIAYSFEVAVGPNDSLHFALTSIGLYKIERGQMENLVPGVVDYLKKTRLPIGLQFLQGRYLFFEIMDPSLVYANVQFSTETMPEMTLTIQEAVSAISIDVFTFGTLSFLSTSRVLNALQQHHDSIQVWRDTGGCFVGIGYCENVDYPIFEDHINATIAPATLANLNANPSPDFFSFGTAVAENSIIGPDQTTDVAAVPYPVLPLDTASGAESFILPNEENFFSKQGEYWDAEKKYQELWLEKLKELESLRREATFDYSGIKVFGDVVENEYTLGPFLDLSFFGESNRIYGEFDLTVDWKGIFMHRSIVKTFEIVVTAKDEFAEPA